MGSQDFGLFDGEESQHCVSRLVRIDWHKSVAHLSVGVALALQFDSDSILADPGGVLDRIDNAPNRDALDDESAYLIEQFERDPIAFASLKAGREGLLDYVLGEHRDGVHHEALYAVVGAQNIVQQVADRALTTLDVGAQLELEKMRPALASLGVLVLLPKCHVPSTHVARWERSYYEADAAQKDNRAFWDIFRRRARLAFRLMRRRAS